MSVLRVLIDPPADGAWNMAVDEALLESAAAGGAATLRFYQWSEPTLSLGYFQRAADRDQHAASRLCPLVRRASGGGAIVHDRELTYSVAWPMRDTRIKAATNLYDACHETLVEVLAAMAVKATIYRPLPDACTSGSQARESPPPFLCFQRRSCGDILCGAHKIVGSAQRRSRGAVLQHGSILLSRSSCAPELPGIRELTTKYLEIPELSESWLTCLSRRLSVSLATSTLSTREAASAREFCETRFANETYNSRR